MKKGFPEIGEIDQNDQKPLCNSSEGQDFWSIILIISRGSSRHLMNDLRL